MNTWCSLGLIIFLQFVVVFLSTQAITELNKTHYVKSELKMLKKVRERKKRDKIRKYLGCLSLKPDKNDKINQENKSLL